MEDLARFNYYDILEVSPHSAQHEVTTAYERAKSTYSGENPAIYTIFSEQEARNLLTLVEEAYSVLGNKTLRARYDEKLGQGILKQENVSFETLQAESKTQFHLQPKKTNEKISYEKSQAIEDEIKEQTVWSGEFLKKVREYKKIPLERMSEITKISAYYINALEKIDSKNLPAPVFVRGYVVQICKVLSLEEKKVCDSYMKLYKDSLGK